MFQRGKSRFLSVARHLATHDLVQSRRLLFSSARVSYFPFRRFSTLDHNTTLRLKEKKKPPRSSNQTGKQYRGNKSCVDDVIERQNNSKPNETKKVFLNNMAEISSKIGDNGVTEIKKDNKESEFMKLWTFTEGHFKDKVRLAVKGSTRIAPHKNVGDVKMVDIAKLIGHGLPMNAKQLDLPEEDDSVTYRIPLGNEFSKNHPRGKTVEDVELKKNIAGSNLGFSNLGVHPKLCAKLQQNGIVNPTSIQKRALPMIFRGKNVLIQSETGSGKTLVFLLPSIQDPGRAYGTVIVVPTRELACQMMYEAHRLLRDKTVVASFVSGVELSEQEHKLRDINHPPRVVIGTPKRLLQIVKSQPSLFQRTKRIVIDEVDKALQPLHRRASVKKILTRASHPRPAKELVDELRKASKVLQIQLIGATATVGEVLKEDLRDLGWGDHVDIVQPLSYIGKHRSVPPDITHNYVVCDSVAGVTKAQALARIFQETNQKSALVFIHRQHSVDDFVWELRDLGMNAVALYQQVANQNPEQFKKFLNDFQSGKIQAIVGTEETVRGLDFRELDVVYLMEVPKNVDEYIHLAGRVGRQGRHGTTITFVSMSVEGEERRLLLQYRRLGLNFKKIYLGQKEMK